MDKTTHTMNCPVEGCEHVIEVNAEDDDSAVQKIMASGKEHFGEAHPDEKGMSPEEMEQSTRDMMKKAE